MSKTGMLYLIKDGLFSKYPTYIGGTLAQGGGGNVLLCFRYIEVLLDH
jgi:hypothetical protein